MSDNVNFQLFIVMRENCDDIRVNYIYHPSNSVRRMDDTINVELSEPVKNYDLAGFEDDDGYEAPEDEQIRRAAHLKKVKIRIVGCGGGGSNTVTRLVQSGLKGADLLAINTDANHLRITKSQAKLLIGKVRTKGKGSGGLPQIGEEAAVESVSDLRNLLKGSDIVFVTCGLGGGTGTGSAPVVAKLAKEANAMVISIVTLPFNGEGKVRMANAMVGLSKLLPHSDTLITIPNDKLIAETPNRFLEGSFNYADSVLTETMKGLTEMIRKTGLINIDYADIKTTMKSGGVAIVGIGESVKDGDKVESAVSNALRFPLIEADISQVRGCVMRVIGGSDMTLKEVQAAMKEVQKRINPDATIFWGTSIDRSMNDKMRVLVLLTGVRSPYTIADRSDLISLGKRLGMAEEELGIEAIS